MTDRTIPHWYVMRTAANYERKMKLWVEARGVEAYLPMRSEMHRWSDRMKRVEVVLTPSLLFVRLALVHRELLWGEPHLKGLMRAPGESVPAPISDERMAEFMEIVERESAFSLIPTPIHKGDIVHVLVGPLEGFEGECMRIDGVNSIVIRLNPLLSAAVTIPRSYVKKIKSSEK